MPYLRSDMTSQTGSAYKAALDAATAALAGSAGKRRNVNGDGRVNQLTSAVAISTAWQYVLDMWEAQAGAGVSGSFGQVADAAFPAQLAIGTAALSTSGAATVALRTKIESRATADLLAPAFQYPVAAPAHPFAALSLVAYQDSGQPMSVTPVLRSADAPDDFAGMSHAISGPTQSLPSGVLTQLWWDGAAGAFQLDTLANVANGLCLEIDIAVPAGLGGRSLRIGDVQLEGGQVATYFGRANFADELLRCQRFYAKTFPLAVAPAQNAGTAGAWIAPQAVGAATPQQGNFWSFPTRMARAPVISFFNPAAANAQARNLDTASDCSGTAADIVGERGAAFGTTTPAGSTAGERLAVHMIADARL
ncbi:MAG TPA: hypothetical protein VMU85_08610 [Stellaceae bacterium]|nr:hypothetical protein [Stellaceae bacterium]